MVDYEKEARDFVRYLEIKRELESHIYNRSYIYGYSRAIYSDCCGFCKISSKNKQIRKVIVGTTYYLACKKCYKDHYIPSDKPWKENEVIRASE